MPKQTPPPAPRRPTRQQEFFRLVQRPTDRSAAWYLNLLADTLEGPPPGAAPHTERQAACLWAGVDVADHTLQGALNLKAGNRWRDDWLPVRTVLNQLAQGKLRGVFNASRGRLLPEREALYEICRREFKQ